MILIFWIFVCAVVRSSFGESRRVDETLGEFVVDVVPPMFAPSTVTALLCVNDDDGFRFARQMSRNRVMLDLRLSIEGLDPVQLASRIHRESSFVIDLDCSGALDILIEASANSMFVAPAQWLILQDLRSPGKSGNASSDRENLIDVDDVSWIYETFENFTMFPDSEVTNPDTWNHLEDYGEKHVDTTTKANHNWVRHLAHRSNATVSFVARDSWGYAPKTGNWTGMIGMIVNGEADLGATGAFIDTGRLGFVDYLPLYTPVRFKFIFKQPPLSHVSNLFTLPFARSVWIATGMLLVFFMGLFYLAIKWEYKIKTIERATKERWVGIIDEEPTLSNNLLVMVGAVFQQGFSYDATAVPTRVVVLMLLFATLSLYVSYTANIVSLLQATTTSINTPRDLMNSPLKIGIFDIPYNHHYFPFFQDPERREFYDKLIKGKDNVWMGLEEGIAKVRKGLFAFHVEVSMGYDIMQKTYDEDEKCGLHEIEYLNMLYPTATIRLKSPYREIFRVGALLISEGGLRDRETSRLFEDKPVCNGGGNFLSVGLIEFYPALVGMAYGVGVTLGIFLLEIICDKWETRKSTRNEKTVLEVVE